MGSRLETKQLGERVRRAWKDYDVCPDFEEQMEALIGCVSALERLKNRLESDTVPEVIVDRALAKLEKVLP
jgi:hypothetical protein